MEELLTHALDYASDDQGNHTDTLINETPSLTGTESGPLMWDGEWDRSDSI